MIEGALSGTLLLLCWGVCWYLFFVRFNRPTTVPVRSSAWFAASGLLLLFALGMWGSQAWRMPAQVPAQMLGVGFVLLLVGQGLMVSARKALPLSNYDLLVHLAVSVRAQGIYRYVWHPMYVGVLLALVGTSLVLGGELTLTYMWFVGIALLVRTAAESMKLR